MTPWLQAHNKLKSGLLIQVLSNSNSPCILVCISQLLALNFWLIILWRIFLPSFNKALEEFSYFLCPFISVFFASSQSTVELEKAPASLGRVAGLPGYQLLEFITKLWEWWTSVCYWSVGTNLRRRTGYRAGNTEDVQVSAGTSVSYCL